MEPLLDELIKLLFTIVTITITAALPFILKKIFDKFNLQVSAENQAKLEKYIQDAILATEEWAATRIKASIPVNAGAKAEKFITIALDKIPGITADEALKLAQQELPKLGLGASGFLRSVTETVVTK